MPTKKCNGMINGKSVKLIVVDKGWKQEYFAKPKNKDINVPHFVNAKGTLEVHEDSANDGSFRIMEVDMVYSGSYNVGGTFASNRGMDFVVLPMNSTANGFAINTNSVGIQVSVPCGNEWCIMAFGTFGPWQPKNKHHDKKGYVSYLP